jgi:hypothetical protein
MELVSITAAVCATVVGAFASVPVVRVAQKRAMAQPIPADHALELAIIERAELAGVGSNHADAHEWFCDRELATRFTAAVTEESLADDELQQQIGQLKTLHEEREQFPGACGFEPSAEAPFVKRGAVQVTKRRVRGTAVACAGSALLAAMTTSDLWAFAGMLLLGLLGWAIALVDYDTLFLDLPLWWIGGPTAMLLTLIGTQQRDGWFGVVVALGCGLVWWVSFEAMNLGYRIVRGVDGVGGGDGMIVFMTVAVAVGATGSATIGMWAVLLSLAAALLSSAPAVVRKERGGRDAFALGPFLACGWQLAVLAYWAGVLA